MWNIAVISVVAMLIWRFINWAWLKPRRIERMLRAQGMKGSPYRFLVGDSRETSRMFKEAWSKPIGINDDITPRIMPSIVSTMEKYGNYSFSWSGPRPQIFINDPTATKTIFNNFRLYDKHFKVISNHIINLLVSRGIGDLSGDEWVKSRSTLNPVFHTEKLKPMVSAIKVVCEETLNEWKKIVAKEGGSAVVDVFHHLENFTSKTLAQLMFGNNYTQEIERTFSQLAELSFLAKVPSKSLHIPGEKYFPTRRNRRAKEIFKNARGVIKSIIDERLKKNSVAQTGSHDLLDVLLEDLYEGRNMDDSKRERVIDDAFAQCKLFFFAGSETSSGVLTWTMLMLAIHKDWQARAREEVFEVLGDKKDITAEDVAKLKILTMIMNETLRLYAPIMELTRVTTEDAEINGYLIPKDSLITVPLLLIQRSKEIWGEDANKFRPDRFAQGVAKATPTETAYMPFGWGPRICIGMGFAQLEMKTFLVMLLRTFSFDFSPTYIHAPVTGFTMQPEHGAPIVLKKI